jgi:hypothetical protein
MIAGMPDLLSGEKPLEPPRRALEEKTIPANAIHPAKIKVCVVRK